MPILLDHQLREQIPLDIQAFPIAFYCDELAALPNRAGPVHWHPYFEIATAQSGVLDYQVGQAHTILEPGDSIFVNQNMLHGIRQLSGAAPDHLPVILFSGTIVAPESSVIYQKYILPVLMCNSLPFIVFRHGDGLWKGLHQPIRAAYYAMQKQPDCYELSVQRNICRIFEEIYRNLDFLPKTEASRVQLNTQIRLQKMLSYIYENYARTVTLADIAGAANISRSGAVLPIIYGMFTGGGAHSVPPSNGAAFTAGNHTDSAGDQFCLRVSFCQLLQPPISRKVRIFTRRETRVG